MSSLYDDEAPLASAGERLDVFLATEAEGLTRSRARTLITEGHVLVNGKPVRASYKIKGGEHIAATMPEASESEIEPEDIPLDILFEDDDLVIVNKAAGMPVHPGAGHPTGTLANALRHRYPEVTVGGALRPGLVHRLDMDTTGVMVCALNDIGHQKLSDQFRARTVDKRYTAFSIGVPKPIMDVVTGHVRDPKDRRRFTTRLEAPDEDIEVRGGRKVRRAHTIFTLIRGAGGCGQLDVELLTGRTHQIRAHAADLGFPLVSDALYSGDRARKGLPPGPVRRAAEKLERQALHARTLSFKHPTTGEMLSFEAPLPEDLLALQAAIEEVVGSTA